MSPFGVSLQLAASYIYSNAPHAAHFLSFGTVPSPGRAYAVYYSTELNQSYVDINGF